jgi:hypothetical protein
MFGMCEVSVMVGSLGALENGDDVFLISNIARTTAAAVS